MRKSAGRTNLIAELMQLLRAYSLESQGLAATYAARQRLHSTDLQILILCMLAERSETPETPGGLSRALSLTSGAVTTALDRLESADHLRRARDSTDRRRVHIRLDELGWRVGREYFGELARRSDHELASFDDAELITIRRFMRSMITVMSDYRRESEPTDEATSINVRSEPGD